MIEKEYYRLDELEEKFGFTANDFRYVCERRPIPLTIYVYSQFFLIAQRILDPTKRVARGVVHYRGLVELPPADRNTILKNGFVKLKFGYLRSVEGVRMLESVSEELLENGLKGNFDLMQVSNIQDVSLDSSDAILIGEENRELLYSKNAPIYEGLDVEFENLVVQPNFAKECQRELGLDEYSQGIKSSIDVKGKRVSQIKDDSKSIDELVFDKPLHKVLAKILIKDPSLKAKHIFRLLNEELLIPAYDREYDTGDILSHMEGDKIVWKDSFGRKKRRTCGIGALEDHLTATKKTLRRQKDSGFS